MQRSPYLCPNTKACAIGGCATKTTCINLQFIHGGEKDAQRHEWIRLGVTDLGAAEQAKSNNVMTHGDLPLSL
jgi:hypothetical protein